MAGKEGEPNQLEFIIIRWGASKQKLGNLVRDAFKEERQAAKFAKETEDVDLQSFFYNLGQSSELKDFPEKIAIAVCGLALRQGIEEFSVKMPFSNFLAQLLLSIGTFMANRPIRTQYPTIYESEIKALRMLASLSEKKQVELFFYQTSKEGIYGLSSAELSKKNSF